MMDEDRGSSLKLLFQLRRTLCPKAKGSVVMAAKGGQSQPRLQKQVKEEPEEQFFDQRLKTLRPIDHRYPYEVHNKHFVDEHTQQLRHARECEAQEVAQRRQNVQDFRLTQHDKMRRSKAAKELAKKVGEQHWQGVQENKYKMMEKDLDFEKEMINRTHLRIAAVRNHYEQDCGFRESSEEGIAWFEKNLQRIGIDTSEHSGTDIATIEAATLKELYEKMNDKLPTKAQLKIESDKRIATIRETKQETDIARKERARRERRVQVEQQQIAAAMEAKKREEELQAQQLLEADRIKEEQAAAEEKKRRKEAQWEERVAKHVAYKEKLEAESEEAWQKMVEKAREERAIKIKLQTTTTKFEDPKDVSSDEDKPAVAAPPVERKRGSIAAHMASKEKTREELSVEDNSASAAPDIEIAAAEELMSCVREQVMMDYLFGRGDWTNYMPSEEETGTTLRRALNNLGENAEAPIVPRLGSVVQWLCKSSPSCTHQAPAVRKQGQLAKDFLPVVALAGSPLGLCGGQSSFAAPLADRLSQEFGFYVIKPNEVVTECINLAEKPPQEPDWPILARMRELGKEALSLRPHGVPPNTFAEMIFRKIELLSAPAPKPVEEEDPKSKKKKDKKEEVPEPVRPNGVVILNYPSEMRQCASWEACLEGSWSNLLKVQDSEENHQARLSTVLAPFWVEEIAVPVIKAEEAELAKGAEKVDFDPDFAPSVRVVRLQFPDEDSSMLEASVSVDNAGQGENAELVAAIQAERRTLARQCQCIAAWTFARLEQMREQYNEIFARMDDWIKDRVREENEAIKETERQLRTGKWEDEEGHQTISRTMTVRRSHTGNVKPAPSSAAGKRRRDVLKVIVPKTLDVNVYVPPKLEVLPSTDTGSMVRSPSTVSQGLGKTRSSFRVPAPEKWSQEMMWGLLTRLTSNLEMGACDAEQLMKALLERRHGALGFENEQVIPPSWVQRPLAVYHLLCRSFVEPAWGATQVDLTEFFLALTHHENFLTWPTMEALEATRSFLHSEESSLSEEELAMYPDVDVSEELFCQLPLWPGGCPSEMRRWMFQVLCCFSQAEICLPPKPGGQDTTPRSVTARRIIGYFGLANAPAKAFSQFCRLLLPAKLFSAAEEDPSPQVLVKDLWTILYSQRTRPAAMMAPVPDLATFCNNLIDEGKVPDAVPKAKAKAKGKAKPEVEEETEAPVIPEKATVAFSEQVLMSRQTVLKALLSHGGLLCRRRGLDMLFPNAGSIFPLKTSAEAEALKELQSLVPEPPPEEEAPAEVAEGS